MDLLLQGIEETPLSESTKIAEQVLDTEVSDNESDEEEEVDASIDSDDSADITEELSDSDIELNRPSNIVSIHETYSKYYSSEKITTPILSKFEKAKILGVRAEMLSNGAEPVISKPYPNNTYLIALEELRQKKIPLIIRRKLPNGKIEDWRLEDLIIRL